MKHLPVGPPKPHLSFQTLLGFVFSASKKEDGGETKADGGEDKDESNKVSSALLLNCSVAVLSTRLLLCECSGRGHL